MLQSRRAILIAFLIVSVSLAHAQLGPKNGEDLKPTDLVRVRVGDLAPDFTLENRDGRRMTLSDLQGKKNVVLVFYRGYW